MRRRRGQRRSDGKQYTIPAFWDGGNTWKARAACPTAGTWYYKTVCSDTSDAQRVNASETGGISTGTVGSLKPNAEYRYQWFDPIAGEYGEAGTFRSTVLGTYYLGEKPSGTDWAVRITPVL